jgi:hypothetical protein
MTLQYPDPNITDTERLDALIAMFESGRRAEFVTYGTGVAGVDLFTVPSQRVRGYTIRGAIDAAIHKLKAPD